MCWSYDPEILWEVEELFIWIYNESMVGDGHVPGEDAVGDPGPE